MTALGYTTTNEVVTGWRIWRVLPFEQFDGARAMRLCAVGTYGIPKLWEPRRPTVAVCSSFTSDHEAPWVDHECGIWALKRPEDARRRMVAFMQTQSEPLGWACGQVSLWGRVIEHEHGWRAQYAYPYAITVESTAETVAAALRAEYAVDVDWNGGDLYEAALTKRRAKEEAERGQRATERAETKRLQRKSDAAIARLREIGSGRARREAHTKTARLAREEQWAQKTKKREEAIRKMPPIAPLDDVSIDDVLAAFVTDVIGNHETHIIPRDKIMPHPWSVENVTHCVLYRRGEMPPLSRGRDVARSGLKEANARVLALLREARDSGFLDYGLPFEDRHSHSYSGFWFITRRGLTRVAKLGAQDAPYYRGSGDEEKRHDVDLGKAVRILRRNRRPLFVEEVEALMPTWMKERRAVQRKGRRAYCEWLKERRATGQAAMLWFTDDEVEAAVRRMRKPARQVDVMDALAPADNRSERFKGEVAHLSAQLVRLHRDGRLSRRKKGSVIWWETAQA